ncbi:MAG: hypothetical protein RL385_5298 [Pseudomonadota bacterium]|jgi:hypothetical protein
MGHTELVLRFDDRAAAEAAYRERLRLGRAQVVTAAALSAGDPVVLSVIHPETGDVLQLAARVERSEMCADGSRVEVALVDDGPQAIARLGGFVAATPDTEAEPDANAVDPLDAPLSPRAARLRNLNEAQRIQVARSSVLEDRVILERLYGPSVWPLLLHNPKITIAEVARIARKGTVPRPLLDLISEHDQWHRQSLVRRALLANPRLGTDSALRLLRATPPRELKLVPQQTAYPVQVRTLAQRLLRGSCPTP